MSGHGFLERVPQIVKEETAADKQLIEFKHPEELESLLDLDVSVAADEVELERCVRQVLRYSVKTGRFAFRNQLYGDTDPYGLAGAWLSEAFNTSQYTFEAAPAFTLVENQLIRHMLRLFGLPPDGEGILSPGGSISNMYAMVVARYRAFPEIKSKGMPGLPTMVVYTSRDSHYSIRKGAHWLGLGTDNVEIVETDDTGRMLVEELEKAIQKTRVQGKFPLMVNATAGTTVLGAVDDLQRVADVCDKHNLWMHVDACWGGSLMLSEKYKHRLRGIQRAHSIAWNPHKMLGAPLQCSVFLTRVRLLHETNAAAARYLFQQDKFYDVRYDTGDKSVQCGRKTDSFKLWVMWKARGDAGFGSLVDGAMDLAEYACQVISTRTGFRLVLQEMQCPNVCFWYIPKCMRGRDESKDWWDKMHKITPKIKELLTLSSRVMVCYTPLRQFRNFFRVAFTCHPPGTGEHVLSLLKAVEEAGETVTDDMI